MVDWNQELSLSDTVSAIGSIFYVVLCFFLLILLSATDILRTDYEPMISSQTQANTLTISE